MTRGEDRRELTGEERLARLERLAWLLDDWVRIPLTPWRIGLDGVLGLVPGLGDILAGALSAWILLEAWRLGLPRRLLWHMVGNIAIDVLVGTIPIGGDLFDFAWKANQRNVRLFREHYLAAGAAPPVGEESGSR